MESSSSVKCEPSDEGYSTPSNSSTSGGLHAVEIKMDANMKHKCSLCNLLFATKASLNSHEKTHAVSHKCKFCDLEFNKLRKINDHFLDDHTEFDEGNLYCIVCKQDFPSETQLVNHIPKEHTHIYKHQCTYCEKSYQDPDELEGHENHVHLGVSPYKCDLCLNSYTSRRSLRTHFREKHSSEGKKFKCSYCSKSYSRNTKLKIHMKIHTDPSLYTCKVCGKTLSNKHSLKEHMYIHTSFECKVCGETFKKRLELQYHSLTHQGMTSFRCADCPKSFARMYELRKHVKIHTNRTKHYCSTCEKSYTDKKTLRVHERRHAKDYKVTCNVCDSKFCTKSELKAHMFVHTRESDHQCHICSLKLRTAGHLKRHIDGHAGMKKFQCSLCQKSFAQKPTLDEHMRAVHGPAGSVKCEICNIVYRYARSLRKHNARVHPEIAPKSRKRPRVDTESDTTNIGKRTKILPKRDRKPRQTSTSDISVSSRDIISIKKSSKRTFLTKSKRKTISARPKKKKDTQGKSDFVLKEIVASTYSEASNESNQFGNYRCELCFKTFRRQAELNSHLNNHPLAELFDCPFCEMVFKNPDELSAHTDEHTGEILKRSAYLRAKVETTCESSSDLNRDSESVSTKSEVGYGSFLESETTSNSVKGYSLMELAKLYSDPIEITPSSDGANRPFDSIDSENCSENSTGQKKKSKMRSQDELQASPDTYKQASPDTNKQASPDTNKQASPDTYKKASPDTYKKASPDTYKKASPDTYKQASPDTYKQKQQCEVCHRYLASKTTLKRHMKMHSSDNGNAAERQKSPKGTALREEKRPKAIGNSKVSTVSDKIAADSEFRPFSCSICGKSFVTNKGFKAHLKNVHKGEMLPSSADTLKPFVCNVCGKRYVERSSLIKHLKSHSEDTPLPKQGETKTKTSAVETFSCKDCEKTFKSKNGLKVHSKRHETPKQNDGPTSNKADAPETTMLDLEASVLKPESRETDKVPSTTTPKNDQQPIGTPPTDLTQQKFDPTPNDSRTDKSFLCKICDKRFSSDEELKQHAKSHVFVRTSNKVVIV